MTTKFDAYVDTSALIAFLDRSDTHQPLFRHLFSKTLKLLTSSLVVSEGQAWFLKRYDTSKALQFLTFVDSYKTFQIATMGSAELKLATALLQKFADHPLTLTDALGLALMNQHKIKSCWSTDRHLGLSGVPLVIHLQR